MFWIHRYIGALIALLFLNLGSSQIMLNSPEVDLSCWESTIADGSMGGQTWGHQPWQEGDVSEAAKYVGNVLLNNTLSLGVGDNVVSVCYANVVTLVFDRCLLSGSADACGSRSTLSVAFSTFAKAYALMIKSCMTINMEAEQWDFLDVGRDGKWPHTPVSNLISKVFGNGDVVLIASYMQINGLYVAILVSSYEDADDATGYRDDVAGVVCGIGGTAVTTSHAVFL